MKNKKILDMILFEIKNRKLTFEQIILIIGTTNLYHKIISSDNLNKLNLSLDALLDNMDEQEIIKYKKHYYINDCEITKIIDEKIEEICFLISQEEEKDIIDTYYDFIKSNTYSKLTDFVTQYYRLDVEEMINDYLIELEKKQKTKIML